MPIQTPLPHVLFRLYMPPCLVFESPQELWRSASSPSDWQVKQPGGTDELCGMSCAEAQSFWRGLAEAAAQAEPLRFAQERRREELRRGVEAERQRQAMEAEAGRGWA